MAARVSILFALLFSTPACAQFAITIDGAESAMPFAERLKQAYHALEPSAFIYVEEGSAPHDWARDLASGRIDIALVNQLPVSSAIDLSGFTIRPLACGTRKRQTDQDQRTGCFYFIHPLALAADVERFVTFSIKMGEKDFIGPTSLEYASVPPLK